MTYYKILNAVEACIKQISVLPKVPPTGFKWIPKWHAVNGLIGQDVGKSLRVDGTGVHNGVTTLTVKDARDIARSIDALNTGSTHADVKLNPNWTAAYQMANRDVDFMDATGALVTPRKQLPTMPCHHCGIVLPIDCIQVDHFMPQAGGEHLYTLKMLRSMGLTAQDPTGAKGTAIRAGNAWGTIHPKARDRGNYDYLAKAITPGAKWSTNDRGAAFLSLLKIKDCLGDLQRACKNSTLNLVPLCGSCNGKKSDQMRQIA